VTPTAPQSPQSPPPPPARRAANVNITPPPAAAARKRGIVLLVEDDQDLRETLEMTLRNHGHQVESASDGSAALSWLRRADPHPCLVLLDLMMPGMSGFELAERLQQRESTARIPILVLTAKDLTAADRERLSYGVSGFVMKGNAAGARLIRAIRLLDSSRAAVPVPPAVS
jgi:DNA-binding response OmpR family regulator